MHYSSDRDELKIKGTPAPTTGYVKRNPVTSARLVTRNSSELMTKPGTRRSVEINPQLPLRRMSAGNAIALSKVQKKTLTRHQLSNLALFLNRNGNTPASFAISNLVVLMSNNVTICLAHLERGNVVLLPRDRVIHVAAAGDKFSNRADLYRHHVLNHVEELPQGNPEQALAGDDADESDVC